MLRKEKRDIKKWKMTTEMSDFYKIIDARENLSIQVHPNDAYAKEHENGIGRTGRIYTGAFSGVQHKEV